MAEYRDFKEYMGKKHYNEFLETIKNYVGYHKDSFENSEIWNGK